MKTKSKTVFTWKKLAICLLLICLWQIGQAQTTWAQSSPTQTGANTAVASLTIQGQVHNATANAPLSAAMPVTLYAYNDSYTQTNSFSTTLEADGRFSFALDNMPTNWVYLASVTFNGLEYTSDIGQPSSANSLDLPITVYERTSDPAAITVPQLEIVLTPLGEQIQVTELYTFNNEATAVFGGAPDDPQARTITISVPESAQNPTFERGAGPNLGFLPVSTFRQERGQWVDSQPLRPGPSSLTLLVTYNVPATEVAHLNHALNYPVDSVRLSMPENGLQLDSADWQQEASQSNGGDEVALTYGRANLAAGQVLTIPLAVDQPAANGSEWLLSAIILLAAAGIAGRMIYLRRRTLPVLTDEDSFLNA